MSIAGRLLDKTRDRVKQAGLPPRMDFHLTDVKEIDKFQCLALVSYDPTAGEPVTSQVIDWVEHQFKGAAHAQGASVSLHLAEHAISVIVTKHALTRPLTDASNFRKLTASSYVDDSTSSIWQVVESGAQKFLVRADETDVTDIVKAQLDRRSRKDASFNTVRQAAPIVVVGDHVKFFLNGSTMYGEVRSINGDNVSLSAGGKSVSVDRHAIYSVVERGQQEIQSEKSLLEDYYAKAFGSPEFAAELTDKVSKEEGNLGSGFSGGKPST